MNRPIELYPTLSWLSPTQWPPGDWFQFAVSYAGAHQNGFCAQDAVHWAEPGKTYAWEQVSELLDTLLAEGILQRMP